MPDHPGGVGADAADEVGDHRGLVGQPEDVEPWSVGDPAVVTQLAGAVEQLRGEPVVAGYEAGAPDDGGYVKGVAVDE